MEQLSGSDYNAGCHPKGAVLVAPQRRALSPQREAGVWSGCSWLHSWLLRLGWCLPLGITLKRIIPRSRREGQLLLGPFHSSNSVLSDVFHSHTHTLPGDDNTDFPYHIFTMKEMCYRVISILTAILGCTHSGYFYFIGEDIEAQQG